MSEKLCACGHTMESRVTGKKIELHTADTGSLWSEFLAADLYICPWCGRMAFFEPEETRQMRFCKVCNGKMTDELRAIIDGEQPELLKSAARKRLEDLEADARWQAEQERKEAEKRKKRKKFFSGLLGKDDDDNKPARNRPPEF